MKATTKTRLSTTYAQLSKLFALLEDTKFEEQTDYGENVAESFCWYISPDALSFLEIRYKSELAEFKNNPRFSWNLVDWHGAKTKGVDIHSNFKT